MIGSSVRPAREYGDLPRTRQWRFNAVYSKIESSLLYPNHPLANNKGVFLIEGPPISLARKIDIAFADLRNVFDSVGPCKERDLVSIVFEHAEKIINEHGIEKASGHLGFLFDYLPDLVLFDDPQRSLERNIQACEAVDFHDDPKPYLELLLQDEIISEFKMAEKACSIILGCLANKYNFFRLLKIVKWVCLIDFSRSEETEIITEIMDEANRYIALFPHLKEIIVPGFLWGNELALKMREDFPQMVVSVNNSSPLNPW